MESKYSGMTPLGITRGKTEIFAQVSVRRLNYSLAELGELKPESSEEAVTILNDYYACQSLPLAEAPAKLFPLKKLLLDSWRYIEDRPRANAWTLQHLKILIKHSRPEESSGGPGLARQNLTLKKQPGKRTSPHIHPRPLPWLAEERTARQIYDWLWEQVYETDSTEPNKGYASKESGKPLKPQKGEGNTLTYYNQELEGEFSREFCADFLPLLRGRPARLIRRFYSAWRSLGAAGAVLKSALLRLLSLTPGDLAVRWLELLACVDQKHHSLFLVVLMESDACLKAPLSEAPEIFSLAEKLEEEKFGDESRFAKKVKLYRFIFMGLAARVNPDFIRDYLVLLCQDTLSSELRYPDFKGFKPGRGHEYNENLVPTLTGLVEWISRSKSFYQKFAQQLFLYCAKTRALGAALFAMDEQKFSPGVAFELADLYLNLVKLRTCDGQGEEFLSAHHKIIHKLLLAIQPEFRVKAIYLLHYNARVLIRRYEESGLDVLEYLAFVARICRPPYKTELEEYRPPAIFLKQKDPEIRKRLLDAPPAALKQLERACRSKNRSNPLARGLRVLFERLELQAMTWFEEHPARFLKLAARVGVTPNHILKAALKELELSPLIRDFELEREENLRATLRFLDLFCQSHAFELNDPVPPRLRAHLVGLKKLDQRRLNAQIQTLLSGIHFMRLEILEELLRRALYKNFGTHREKNPAREHSLRMYHFIDSNRRQLRRFLKQDFLQNETDEPGENYIARHPANKNWLRKRGYPMDLWRGGPEQTYRIQLAEDRPESSITLSLENNPHEILKLGTYADSCLALGGAHAYSAAAILLDINKAAVFARGPRGAFLARQVLAICEENRLVCFQVYPDNADQNVVALFKDYDRTLAGYLGLRIQTDEHEDYTILNLLSQEWWDDGYWDPVK